MNKTKVIGLLLAVIIFIVGAACGLMCRSICIFDGPRGTFGGKFTDKKDFSGSMLQKFARDLNLNEEQKQKIKLVLDRQKLTMDKLAKEMRPKIDAEMNTFRAQVRELLNEDQKAKFDKIIAKHHRRMNKFDGRPENKGCPSRVP